ncbi:MAG TPA: cytochrome c biogenesis protein CcdA, partial [Acidimicrobiales bacterium]
MIASLPASLLAAIPLAIAAGLISFLSPCVLPLVPGYVAFLTGVTGRIEGRSGRGRAFIGSLAFVFGFALVFISFGALFGGLGKEFNNHQRLLEIIFGVVTIGLGLFFAGWWPSSWLQRERRIHRLPRVSILGAAALGFTFGLGWS